MLAFFAARNRDGAAEDLLHELWLALPREGVHIDAPLSYMYSMANSLVIKQYHRENQNMARDRSWSEATGPAIPDRSDQPSADRVLAARETVRTVLSALAGEGERVFRIFHRHRVDGLTQAQVAAEMGVSIGTVEGDLRRARRVLSGLRDNADESLP
ncbi:hypothetical protein ASG29_03420 [Sphingomonas sp. Leaf412]|nr:hypothetical protein ASG29_03420 [Sphingomonas sp. Leaf412]